MILTHNHFIGSLTYLPSAIRESRSAPVAPVSPPWKLGVVGVPEIP